MKPIVQSLYRLFRKSTPQEMVFEELEQANK